jgi:hypothetical protein
MKAPCKYCLKRIDTRGMLAHIHFRHRCYVAREFSLQPIVLWFQLAEDGLEPRFTQLQLPAPSPLTVYSRRPLGFMAAPIPEHRRPKGYQLPYGYARPADLLRTQVRYGYIFT